MRSGRPKNTVVRERVTVYIDKRIIGPLYLRLMDPTRGAVRYGALSQLTERLYSEWLKETLSEKGKK